MNDALAISVRCGGDGKTDKPNLTWQCRFLCGKTRVYEGGRPAAFDHLDICLTCGSRVAVTPEDRAAVGALIDQNLF